MVLFRYHMVLRDSMQDATTLLQASFPWLTAPEAVAVVAALPPLDQRPGSASTAMRATAAALDAAGLPPTSSLLLALCGGSKSTALQLARDTARARFERATAMASRPGGISTPAVPTPAPPAIPVVGDSAPSSSPAKSPPDLHAPPASVQAILNQEDRELLHKALQRLEGVAQDVHWLKSTVDTERQLRRAVEVNGELPEFKAPRGASTPAERRNVVAQLSSSLEKDRFGAMFPRDSADGPEE